MVIGRLCDELAQTQKELDKTTVQLAESKTKVKDLQEQTKSLKRKHEARK